MMKKKLIDHKVLLLDTTLREGEQTPGVTFTVEEKLAIARKLDEMGIHMIEAGDPKMYLGMSKKLFEEYLKKD